MSLHGIIFRVKRFIRRMDAEVVDAARMNAHACACAAEIKDRDQHRSGEKPTDPAATRPYHATLFGA